MGEGRSAEGSTEKKSKACWGTQNLLNKALQERVVTNHAVLIRRHHFAIEKLKYERAAFTEHANVSVLAASCMELDHLALAKTAM